MACIQNGMLAVYRRDYVHLPQNPQCRVQQEGYWQMGLVFGRGDVRLYSGTNATLFVRLQVCPLVVSAALIPFMHT